MARDGSKIDEAMQLVGELALSGSRMAKQGWKFSRAQRLVESHDEWALYFYRFAGDAPESIVVRVTDEVLQSGDRMAAMKAVVDSATRQLKAKTNPLASAVLRLQEAARLIDRQQFRAGRELLLDTMVEISAVMEERGELGPGERIEAFETKPPSPPGALTLEALQKMIDAMPSFQGSAVPNTLLMGQNRYAALMREMGDRSRGPSDAALQSSLGQIRIVTDPSLRPNEFYFARDGRRR